VAGVGNLVLVIDQALAAIPNVSTFKSGQNFNVKGGPSNNIIVEDSDEEEEVDPLKQQEMIRKQQEAEDSRELDVKMASDKIINTIRDQIINNASTIRTFFGIKSFEQNYIMRKIDLKKSLKNILASQATNDEIEMFMSFLDNYQQEETE